MLEKEYGKDPSQKVIQTWLPKIWECAQLCKKQVDTFYILLSPSLLPILKQMPEEEIKVVNFIMNEVKDGGDPRNYRELACRIAGINKEKGIEFARKTIKDEKWLEQTLNRIN